MQHISEIPDTGRVNSIDPIGGPEHRDELLDLRGAARLEHNQIRWMLDWIRSASDREIHAIIVCNSDAIRLVLRTLRITEVATICSSEEYETVCVNGVSARHVSLAHPEQETKSRSLRGLARSLLFGGVLLTSLAMSGCKAGMFVGTGQTAAVPAAIDEIGDR